MTLIFELRRQYGKLRYFPRNAPAVAVLSVATRASATTEDLYVLESGGFTVRVDHNAAENIEWRR